MRQLVNAITVKTSKGMLSKAVYKINDELYLVKGCTEGCYQPISEVLGSRIFRKLVSYPVLEYNLDGAGPYIDVINTYGFEYVSICKKIPFALNNFYNYLEGIIGKRKVKVNETNVLRYFIELGLDLKYLYQMLVVDALIGNEDRHWNNLDVCTCNEGHLQLAPMLDLVRHYYIINQNQS